MTKKKLLLLMGIMMSTFIISSLTWAAPSAELFYWETDIGGNWYQYDYIAYNTSDAGEFLWDIGFWFDETATFIWLNVPNEWSTEHPFMIGFEEAWTLTNKIPAGDSLSGFSFKIDYRAGDMDFDAYFDNGTGSFPSYAGVSSVVPEPISAILFITGGAVFVGRRYLLRRKRQTP